MTRPLRLRVERQEEGQATVELALVLPLVALLALSLLQVGLVGRDAVLVTSATRDLARTAALGTEPRASQVDPPLHRDRLHVSVTRAEGRARVGVAYHSPTDVPLIGRLVPDIPLFVTVSVREERSQYRLKAPLSSVGGRRQTS